MSSEWPRKRLGDYCLKIGSGATPKGGKDSYFQSGIFRLIRSQNIYNEGFNHSGMAFISEEQAQKLNGVEVMLDDVLLNITGDSVARVCQVPSHFLPARVNQHVAIIRPKPEVFNARYLRYFLASPTFQEYMLGLAAAGATRNALTKAMIEDFMVPCPSMAEQLTTSGVLGALDDRITLLRETNATLEAIAQALFKSWFVDFDPVRAKMEGRAPERMDEETAALFPDGFEASELGLVPRGWRIRPIGEVVDHVGGGTPDTKNTAFWEPPEYWWATPKDLSSLQAPVLLSTQRKLSAQGLERVSSGLLPAGTLLMSSRAPIGYLTITQTPLAVNQGFIAMLPSSQLPPLYLLFWCRKNMDVIKGRANGSTFMEISKKAFRPIPVLVPSTSVMASFVAVVSAMFARLVENERQTQSLADIRDALLPRLISGQLRLAEAQAGVEALAG